MFPGAKIIAVDDNEDELEAIVRSLKALGLACIAYNYPDEMPDDIPNTFGLRLLFLDINLVPGASPEQDANVLNAPVSMIDRLVSDKNGPYALITWSSTDHHEALIERLTQLDSLKSKLPFYSRSLAKEQFLEKPDELNEEVTKILSENAPFGALLDWEKRLSRAGEAVLTDLYDFSHEFPAATPSEQMDYMLSKLAVDAFGARHVDLHRFEAANEALMPILNDAINIQFFEESDTTVWQSAITKHTGPIDVGEAVVKKLNTSVFIESSEGIMPYRRGAILRIPEKWKTDNIFEKYFGAKAASIRGNLLKVDKPKKLDWVLIQAQAACDFAQGRVGPMPFLLGAICPGGRELKTDSNGKELKRPAYVWESPLLSADPRISDEDYYIAVVHGIVCPMTDRLVESLKFEVLGRLKDQIIGSLAHEYHSHGSRPGFVSFR